MPPRVQSVKGTRDLLPPDTAVWAAVEATAREVFGRYGFREIRTPIFEETELFVRGVGESSDIVGKEMYSFEDKGGRRITLRPENTASVCRAYVEHGMHQLPQPVRLLYIGPQFRNEKPQKGRYRQFHQIGIELLGGRGAASDVEVLLALVAFLRAIGFSDLTILINTVGDKASRARFKEQLVSYLEPLREKLSEESRVRLATNPLRILDSKSLEDKALLAGAPSLEAALSDESRQHFEAVRSALDHFGIAYRVAPGLVRGLDYYTNTVFEVVSEGLGAQDAICGGGAYEGLVEELGGPPTYAVGFAIGEDRLIDVLPPESAVRRNAAGPLLVAPGGRLANRPSVSPLLELVEEVRRQGWAALEGPAKKDRLFALAESLGSTCVLFLGEEELAAGTVVCRDLRSREQRSLLRADLMAHLQREFS
jgi:histidyl-tRNA synthetase